MTKAGDKSKEICHFRPFLQGSLEMRGKMAFSEEKFPLCQFEKNEETCGVRVRFYACRSKR